MKKLDKYLSKEYRKNDPDLYRILFMKTDIAIRNADRLLNQYVSSSPGRNDPSTIVHELVKELLKQAKPLR